MIYCLGRGLLGGKVKPISTILAPTSGSVTRFKASLTFLTISSDILRHSALYINGIEGFWSFAKERLIRYHGISRERFPLYIKEMEWRYNNRVDTLHD